MRNVQILFTRRNLGSAHDDKVSVTAVEGCPEMFNVVYMSPEFKKERRFTASYSSTLQYVEDILLSLQHDTEPFELVQMITAIHPTVLFHVADMCDCEIRRILMNQVRDSLRFDVTTTDE